MGVTKSITIGVSTYGSREWIVLAAARAIPSAEAQGVAVVYRHGETLAEARNAVLAATTTEFLVNLDADDELEAGYVQAMMTAAADLRAPAVRYVKGTVAHAPYVPKVAGHRHACTADCMVDGNWCVVGTCARTELLRAVGGWQDETLYEDWSIFARCVKAGGTLEAVPSAVYRAHVRPDSRNRAPDRRAREQAHWEIHRAVWPEMHEAAA